jgi:FAD/FMN-containing dehydrogenase
MIGNNACGTRALGYGRTSDNVVKLDVVYGPGATNVVTKLSAVADANLARIRTSFGQFPR